jgi:hypothetical protein
MTLSKPVIITALVLIAMALTVTTYGAITVSKNLSSTGSINASPNLGVYSDSACTTTLSSINWGTITPNSTVTQTIYIKNTGTGASLVLHMVPSSWNPTSASTYMTITWNRESTTLAPGASTAATITLTVSSSIVDITSFSVQITITGTA